MEKYSKSIVYLKNYFSSIKTSVNLENDDLKKRLDLILEQINSGLLITDLDLVLDFESYLNKNDDNKLYEIFYGICLYNENIHNKKVKSIKPILDKDIDFNDVKLNIKDILNYLKVDIDELDKDIAYDLNKYIKKEDNLQKIKSFANFINDVSLPQYKLFGKISDNNILVSILIHSSIDNIKSIIDCFKEKNGEYNINYINKIINSNPYVFLTQYNISNPKYQVPLNYANFLSNIYLFKEYDIMLKNVINQSVVFINSSVKNENNFKKISEYRLDLNSIIKYVGNILSIKPEIVFKNISLLQYYNIPLTNDNNNNGYTILGINDLDYKIDYLLENGIWSKQNGLKYDNIDLIRALIIKDDYLKWKNNDKCDILDIVPNLFQDNILDENAINSLYDNYKFLKKFDSNYLVNDCYQFDGTKVSKHRLLKNLNNIKIKNLGKEDILKYSIMYGSNLDSEVANSILSKLEMGDNSVKLSKGI